MTFKTCSVCGREFIAAAQHMYSTQEDGRKKLQCSYSCWNKAKAKLPPKKKHRKM